MEFRQCIVDSVRKLVNLCVWLFLALFLVHIYEFLAISASHFYTAKESGFYSALGLLFDVGYLSKAVLLIFIFYCVGNYFSSKIMVVFRILFTILLFLDLGLISFFAIAGFPLDRVVFVYSFNEIIDILQSSQKAPFWHYVFIIGIPTCFFVFSKRIILEKRIPVVTLCGIILLTILIPQPHPSNFSDSSKYNIVENKLAYMCKSFKNTSYDESSDQIAQYVDFLQKKFPNQEFVDKQYPFLHKDNSPDVLSPFFNLSEEKPNIVIIVAEGLGREFSGKNSIVPSATPFLDSLSKSALTWNNCLSTSQRTICALPSILGALPFGKSGFMNYKESAPNFNSLYKILKSNGYTSSFFYGGWLCFDDMCHFLRLNNVDTYLDVALYDSVPQRNNWGLYDDFVFQRAIDTLTFNETPRIDVYLTLTTHDPFEYPNEQEYCNRYRNIVTKSGTTFSEEKLLKEYASYLYLDECLRKLISAYKNKPGFDRTIFVITGDHDFCSWREPMICHNVPLLIWSPRLLQSRQMDAVVSHRDITPSLLAFLNKQYNIQIPKNESFLNTGLDTTMQFQSKTFSPLMDVGRHLYGLIYNDLFYYQNETYKISYDNERLSLSKTTAEAKLDSFADIYKALDLYVCENNMLIENKDTGHYSKREILTISSNTNPRRFITQNKSFKSLAFEGEEPAFVTDELFPLTIAKHTVESNEVNFVLSIRSQFFIPSLKFIDENRKEICIITEITRNGEQLYWTNENLNENWFTGYDTWFDYQTKKDFRKENYHYQEGDIITFYIWNKAKRTFYLSNLQASLYSISNED